MAGSLSYYNKDYPKIRLGRMKYGMRIGVIFYLAVFLVLPALINDSYGGSHIGVGDEYVPAEVLLYPTTDDINLSGKNYLEFRWIRTDLARTDYFDFRLYKGYNTVQSSLIFKKQFSSNVFPIEIPASLFENGQVYSWVLVQVFFDGRKGDKSFSSFKIINK